MTESIWCKTDPGEKNTPAYRSNLKAIWIIFGVSISIWLWYAAASVEALQAWMGRKSRDTSTAAARNESYEQVIQANLLSGLLVTMIAISLLFTSFPESIEATLVVILALSQASALGWLDFPPNAKFRDVFCTKLPDVFALGLTLWAAWEAKETYFETHSRDTMVFPDPWLPFAICSAANEAVMMFVYFLWLLERRQTNPQVAHAKRSFKLRIWTGCALLCASSIAGAGVSMKFARFGCVPFNYGLWIAPFTLIFGDVYAIVQTLRRLDDFNVEFRQQRRSESHELLNRAPNHP